MTAYFEEWHADNAGRLALERIKMTRVPTPNDPLLDVMRRYPRGLAEAFPASEGAHDGIEVHRKPVPLWVDRACMVVGVLAFCLMAWMALATPETKPRAEVAASTR